jgi:hypothetical protein
VGIQSGAEIRIMAGCGNTVWCRNLFKKFEILPLTSQYMLSLFMFVVQNKNFFLTNNESQSIDTRHRSNLYLPQANLTIYQKGAYCLGITIFNNLPLEIKIVADNQKKFKLALKNFYTLTLSIQWKSTLLIRELCTILQDSLL